MRFSWKCLAMLVVLVIFYTAIHKARRANQENDTPLKTISKETRLTNRKRDLASKQQHRKRMSYSKRKELIKYRLRKLVVGQNLTELEIGGRKRKPTKKKSAKEMDNGNYRLHRLLFQMWDTTKRDDQTNMLNCDNLVSSDTKTNRQGRRFARKLNRKFYEYVNVSEIHETVRHGCLSILNVFKYRTPRFSQAAYPIAYTITLDRTAEQSLRLLSSIYHHDNLYCLHPNAKFGAVYLSVFKKLSECLPNVVLPEKIYGIRVKTYNRLRAQLACFKRLLNSTVPWRYGINLPSSAFPLRNNSHIVQYLKQKPYENLVPWEVPAERFEKRYKYSFVVKEIEGETLLLRTNLRKTPPPLKIFRKGEHFVSTREFWHFITESHIAHRFLEWARDTKNPEDFFYASLNRHREAPGGTPYIEDDDALGREPAEQSMVQTWQNENVVDLPATDLLANLWKSDRSVKCHGVYRGYMCIYGAADLRWVLQQDSLFAFSFDFRVDRVAVDCLTKHVRNPILPEYGEQLSNPFS